MDTLTRIVDASGYMTKRGKIVHTWKRRFFVLEGANFFYYSNEAREVLLGGGICLAVSKWDGKKNGLLLTCEGGRCFQLTCDSGQDCDRWHKAFLGAVTLKKRSVKGLRIHAAHHQEQAVGKKSSQMQVTLGNFKLLQTVGKGGFGKVLLVQREGDLKVYAMKILKKQHVVNTRQVNATHAERRILQAIEHPFVVKLRYAFQSASKLYMVMDYYSGGSLFYHLERNGIFPENVVSFYAAEMTLALSHLHQHGVIYRDLKLENILMDSDGHIALTDFGLSKDHLDCTDLTSTFCGTPLYVAPELIQKQPYSFSVDWWALGVVMFELLSGRVPFASRDRRRIFVKIVNSPVRFCSLFSENAQSIIGGLLIKDPKQRLGCTSDKCAKEDIQRHNFFIKNGIRSFDKIFRKEVPPPFKPTKEYICESNVRGIEARDTEEISDKDIYNFANFTLLDEENSQGDE